MFGISFPELLLVMAIIIILFGPDRLPDLARKFGKAMGVLRKSSDALRREFYNAVYTPTDEIRRGIDSAKRELVALESGDSAREPTKTPGEEQRSSVAPARLTRTVEYLLKLPASELTCEDKAFLEREQKKRQSAGTHEDQ